MHYTFRMCVIGKEDGKKKVSVFPEDYPITPAGLSKLLENIYAVEGPSLVAGSRGGFNTYGVALYREGKEYADHEMVSSDFTIVENVESVIMMVDYLKGEMANDDTFELERALSGMEAAVVSP